ncbi:MAG: hypothetical protein C7B44_04635 [Sulfobacillus thermosulfidooxidans]|uniref:Uncharacterized protein n=2 Tax=Sulfobacillus thermosulfidooxidans TaxID=28034 RepID=A0A1W1WPE1_SULTA|nr:hypothetical protein [Sulfobacillus thermosulfidooxidans]PSR24393.1 MAG: hypothetical protein C7B47_14870 [Sulfobacillus thermosulfidooxidans]PSR37255.1 MAG: hypothetical protein C7B44_04635 [Sulfobacillus thermosulfidooxidans]SMC08177.1 hypothetical protein SAMN00768000_3716 [Sulfobacillus thermosulfidooxidans DSM 9293]
MTNRLRVRALSQILSTYFMWLRIRFLTPTRRRVPAISGHLQEIIWAVIIVVLGLVAYAFFGNGGAGSTWFHNILNSVTQFTD